MEKLFKWEDSRAISACVDTCESLHLSGNVYDARFSQYAMIVYFTLCYFWSD